MSCEDCPLRLMCPAGGMGEVALMNNVTLAEEAAPPDNDTDFDLVRLPIETNPDSLMVKRCTEKLLSEDVEFETPVVPTHRVTVDEPNAIRENQWNEPSDLSHLSAAGEETHVTVTPSKPKGEAQKPATVETPPANVGPVLLASEVAKTLPAQSVSTEVAPLPSEPLTAITEVPTVIVLEEAQPTEVVTKWQASEAEQLTTREDVQLPEAAQQQPEMSMPHDLVIVEKPIEIPVDDTVQLHETTEILPESSLSVEAEITPVKELLLNTTLSDDAYIDTAFMQPNIAIGEEDAAPEVPEVTISIAAPEQSEAQQMVAELTVDILAFPEQKTAGQIDGVVDRSQMAERPGLVLPEELESPAQLVRSSSSAEQIHNDLREYRVSDMGRPQGAIIAGSYRFTTWLSELGRRVLVVMHHARAV